MLSRSRATNHRLKWCVVVGAVLSALPLPGQEVSHVSAQTSTEWRLQWSDEFNGEAGSLPNSKFWGFDRGLPPDHGQNYNCDRGQNSDGCDPLHPNVFQDGSGHLVIEARRATAAPNGITSGRIRTTVGPENGSVLFGTQYGRMEARLLLPVTSGNQGSLAAFWMLGTDIARVGWPASGEIDVLEYIGARDPTEIYGTLHGPGYAGKGIGVRAAKTEGWAGWHTFGIVWSPNQVQFYVDDPSKVYGTVTKAEVLAATSQESGKRMEWPFEHPFFLILNLNMGGPFPGDVDATTVLPQRLLVDWVRVYKSK